MGKSAEKLTASVAEKIDLDNFLKEFRTNKNMTLDEAKEKLMAIVAKVDANAEGSITVFYTGKINGMETGEIVKILYNQGADIRIIHNTEASKFVDGTAFRDAVSEVFGLDDNSPDWSDWNSPVNQWLNAAKNGPWAKISENFAKATVGEVVFFGPNANYDRVFGQTELPELLRDGTSVTHIQGFSIEALKALQASQSTRAVFEKIRDASAAHAYYTFDLKNGGTWVVSATDFDRFLNLTHNSQNGHLGTYAERENDHARAETKTAKTGPQPIPSRTLETAQAPRHVRHAGDVASEAQPDTVAQREKQRLVVLKGQRTLQEKVGDIWEDRKTDPAGALGSGIYNLHTATQADKRVRHEGEIIFTTDDKIYQQVNKRMVAHDRKNFDIMGITPLDAGKFVDIAYDTVGKASITPALKRSRSRSL
jgi:hypothetical protein